MLSAVFFWFCFVGFNKNVFSFVLVTKKSQLISKQDAISTSQHSFLFSFHSFYDRKYKVFLQLFSHQREYQALMKHR